MTEPSRTMGGLAFDVIDIVPPWSAGRRPVVFHHGIGTDRNVWTDWLPAMVTQHKVVRFDTRGFGQSSVPPADYAWTLDGALSDLVEIMALAADGPVHLVGESFGGTVCLLAACRHPDRIASVTVSNAAFRGAGIVEVAGWRAAFERQGIAAWSRDMMAKRFAPGRPDEARHAWFQSVQDRSPAHVTAGIGELLARTDLTPELPRLEAPLLILMPDRSPFVTARMGVDLAEAVPHAELAMMPGARHGLPLSHGSECGAHLAAHIDRAEATLRARRTPGAKGAQLYS